MAAGRKGVVWSDQVRADLERTSEQRLGGVWAALLDVDRAEVLERHRHAGALWPIDLLADAHRLGEIAFRRGEVAGSFTGKTQRVVVDARLLVLGPILANDER